MKQQNSSLIAVYSKTAELMQEIFASGDELFDVEKLRHCVEEIIEVSQCDQIFPLFLGFISLNYSTYEHSTNVAFLSAILGQKLSFELDKMRGLVFAALTHDLGKLHIDAAILDKPTLLEEDEFEQVKMHSRYGTQILIRNGVDDLSILHGVLYHHERLDGSGYPEGLKGRRIPKYARIIGMCDVFDALTTRRTFRRNYSSFEALIYMKRELLSQLDRELVNVFITLHRRSHHETYR
ncbi:MAG: HD domain-containing protein [Campylobacterales bacterium]|nr:HD domain-containing protein [Campylobacterales bacterium]